jgi:hypothetical protein
MELRDAVDRFNQGSRIDILPCHRQAVAEVIIAVEVCRIRVGQSIDESK